jgi:hypothetical protein
MANDFFILDNKVPFRGNPRSASDTTGSVFDYTVKTYLDNTSYSEGKLLLVDEANDAIYRVTSVARPFISTTVSADVASGDLVGVASGGGGGTASGYTVKAYTDGQSYPETDLLLLDESNDILYKVENATRPFVASTLQTDIDSGDILAVVSPGLDDYITTLPDTLQMTTAFGSKTYTVAQLKALGTHSAIFNDAHFAEILAYRQTNRYVTLSGVSSQTIEVGTSLSPSLSASFNQGEIRNGDGSVAGTLVGSAQSYVFRDPSDTTIPQGGGDATNQRAAPSYKLGFGTYTWDVTVSYAAGTTLYYDNLSVGQPGATPDTNLSSQTGSGSTSDNSSTVTTRFRYFRYTGNQGTFPTSSSSIRSLTSAFLNGSNEASFNFTVNSGTQAFCVITKSGKTVTAFDPNTNDTLTATTTSVTVNDNGGDAQIYEAHEFYLGFTGFPDTTTFQITIG